MGYYTQFNLTIKKDKIGEDKIEEDFTKCFDEFNRHRYNGEFSEIYLFVANKNEEDPEMFYGAISEEECKWYDYKQEMLMLSTEFPAYLFDLYGEGDENGDIWHHYFKGNKDQLAVATMTFEPCKL